MKDFPFSVHDFFVYLASGLLLLLVVAHAFDLWWVLPSQPALQLVVAVVVAYTVGQVLGFLSSLLIERFFLTYVLGRMDLALLGQEPVEFEPCTVGDDGIPRRCKIKYGDHATLLAATLKEIRSCVFRRSRSVSDRHVLHVGPTHTYYRHCQLRSLRRRYRTAWLRRSLFASAFEPLPPTTRKLVLDRASTDKVEGPGIFTKAFATLRADERRLARMGTFLYLYEFARNTCMASIVAALLLAARAALATGIHGDTVYRWFISALVCVLLSFVMLVRYLEFLHRYDTEVFKAYAYPSPEAGA